MKIKELTVNDFGINQTINKLSVINFYKTEAYFFLSPPVISHDISKAVWNSVKVDRIIFA